LSEAKRTTNHEAIRKWAEERGGRPARVKGTAPGGLLRIDFGEPEPGLEEIGWDEFFAVFEENDLDFLHQDRTEGGGKSRFNKLVNRQ